MIMAIQNLERMNKGSLNSYALILDSLRDLSPILPEKISPSESMSASQHFILYKTA